MPKDKSLFYYGSMFHRVFDPLLAEGRQIAIGLIPEGASVLDVACGTGAFAFMLKKEKNCRVMGIDLSLKMIEFARKSSPYPDVTFQHADATDLSAFADFSFDYCTILNLMHELSRVDQAAALMEALRVASRAVITNWVSPIPKNMSGIVLRIVEATIGHDHNRNFNDFIAAGGFANILKESTLPITVEYRRVFSRDCREAVLISTSGHN